MNSKLLLIFIILFFAGCSGNYANQNVNDSDIEEEIYQEGYDIGYDYGLECDWYSPHGLNPYEEADKTKIFVDGYREGFNVGKEEGLEEIEEEAYLEGYQDGLECCGECSLSRHLNCREYYVAYERGFISGAYEAGTIYSCEYIEKLVY